MGSGASKVLVIDESQVDSAQGSALQTALAVWVQCLNDWYPHLHTRTYFLPPLRFNRVPYGVAVVAGQPVLVPQPASDQPPQVPAAQTVQLPNAQPSGDLPVAGSVWSPQSLMPAPITEVFDNDVRDDAAMERFLQCLKTLSKHLSEVMMVISELDFRKYLDDQTDPINIAASVLLPRPCNMARQYRRGEIDVLIIHRHYGLIIAEVKSVGATPQNIPDLYAAVVKRVQKAIRQLNKAQVVLRHLVSDMGDSVNVTKTIILPNITSVQLFQALCTDKTVSQELCRCLCARDLRAAVDRCQCGDQMPPMGDLHFLFSIEHLSKWARLRKIVYRHLHKQRSRHQAQGGAMSSSGTGLSQVCFWWQRAVLNTGPDTTMTDCRYEQLLARFCGPATTVDIRTVTAPRKVVRSQGDAVAETGLIMSSLALYPEQVDLLNRNLTSVFLWAAPGCGKTVVLVLKAMQLKKQLKDVHLISIYNAGLAVCMLAEQQIDHSLGAAAPLGRLYRHHFDFLNNPEYVSTAVNELAKQARSGILNVIIDEVGFEIQEMFTQFIKQLRAAVPALTVWAAGVYCPTSLPRWLQVEKLSIPLRCPPAVCREVKQSWYINDSFTPRFRSVSIPAATDGPAVQWLRHTGHTGHARSISPKDCELCGHNIASLLTDELFVGKTEQGGLQWCDVVILGDSISDRSALVRGLRCGGVPVKVVGCGASEDEVGDFALAKRNEVTVTDYATVSGLERRVVVGMMGVELRDRLAVMSRCTSQLVWIDKPWDD